MFPSGEQVEISRGDHVAVAVTVGGGLRSYTVAGVPVLDAYEETAIADGARGQLLVPWPNRLRDGSYDWDGRRLQLPLTEPERGNAIHGLARWERWDVAERTASRALLSLDLPPQPGYPFAVRFTVEYALVENGLRVRQTATNLGSAACPYGSGAHPYLTAGSGSADDWTLIVPATTRLLVDERQLPVGATPVDGTPFDFRQARRIGADELDTAYTDLTRGGDGLAWASIEADGRTVRLWVDGSHTHLMVFTGDTLAPKRRRRSVAIEPMTCAPNAFQSGDGLRGLEPGASFSSEWGIAVR